MNEETKSSEWDLCPDCERPWAYHYLTDEDEQWPPELLCPKVKPKKE